MTKKSPKICTIFVQILLACGIGISTVPYYRVLLQFEYLRYTRMVSIKFQNCEVLYCTVLIFTETSKYVLLNDQEIF